MKHRLSTTISLCLLLIIIGAVCYANIYERSSDRNPCLSKYGINEGFGSVSSQSPDVVHIVSQNVRVSGKSIYYDIGFDREVELIDSSLIKFNFTITMLMGPRPFVANIQDYNQDENNVCHFELTSSNDIVYPITLNNSITSGLVAADDNTIIDWSNLITRFESDTVAYPTLTFSYTDLNDQDETYTVTGSTASITVPMISSGFTELNISVDYPDAVITSIDQNTNARWSGLYSLNREELRSGHILIRSSPIVTSGYPSVCNLSFTPNGIIADKTLMPISVEIDFDAVVIGGFTATNSQIINNHDWYAMTLTPTITHIPSDIGSFTLVLNESEFDDIFYNFSIEGLSRNLYFFPSQDPFSWYDNQISSYTHNIVDNAIVLNYLFDISPEDKYGLSPIDVTHVYTNGIVDYNTVRGSIYTGVVSDSGKNYPVITERYGYNVSYSFNMIPVVNRVNITSQQMRYEVIQGDGNSNARAMIEYQIGFNQDVVCTGSSVQINNFSVMLNPSSDSVSTYTFVKIVDLGTSTASTPEIVNINAESVKHCFSDSDIDWSNLKTSWAPDEIQPYYVHIVQEYWYVDDTYAYYMVAFDSPIVLSSALTSVKLNVLGLSERNFTPVSLDPTIINSQTGYPNSVLLFYKTSSGSLRKVNGMMHDNEAADMRPMISSVSGRPIDWGSDYFTRSIPNKL